MNFPFPIADAPGQNYLIFGTFSTVWVVPLKVYHMSAFYFTYKWVIFSGQSKKVRFSPSSDHRGKNFPGLGLSLWPVRLPSFGFCPVYFSGSKYTYFYFHIQNYIFLYMFASILFYNIEL